MDQPYAQEIKALAADVARAVERYGATLTTTDPDDVRAITSARDELAERVQRFVTASVETTGWGNPFRSGQEVDVLTSAADARFAEIVQTFRLRIVGSLEGFLPGANDEPRADESDTDEPDTDAARAGRGIAAAVTADGWKPERYTSRSCQQVFEVVSDGVRVTLSA